MKRNLGIRKAKQEARRIVRKVMTPERLRWRRTMFWHTVAGAALGLVLGLALGFLCGKLVF